MERVNITALSEEEREEIYYETFRNAISSCDASHQEQLKEEYKVAYAEMLERRARIEEQQRIHRQNNPGGLMRSYANCYKLGSFTVFWMEKRLEYNA
jgi:hypothetical protein